MRLLFCRNKQNVRFLFLWVCCLVVFLSSVVASCPRDYETTLVLLTARAYNSTVAKSCGTCSWGWAMLPVSGKILHPPMTHSQGTGFSNTRSIYYTRRPTSTTVLLLTASHTVATFAMYSSYSTVLTSSNSSSTSIINYVATTWSSFHTVIRGGPQQLSSPSHHDDPRREKCWTATHGKPMTTRRISG